MLDSDLTRQQLLMEAAGKEGLLWVFKQFKELKGIKWGICTEDNKTLLYFLLNGNVGSQEKRREVLTWLMEPEQKGICDELSRTVNKKDSEGVSVLATACKMSGQGDLLLSEKSSPTRDSVIEWLLGLGADITDVPFTQAKDFFDRWRHLDLTKMRKVCAGVSTARASLERVTSG